MSQPGVRMLQMSADCNAQKQCLAEYLVDDEPYDLPQELKRRQGCTHGHLSIGIGVQPVVCSGQEQAQLGVKGLVDQALHEVLEQATTVDPRFFYAMLVHEGDLEARLQDFWGHATDLIVGILQSSYLSNSIPGEWSMLQLHIGGTIPFGLNTALQCHRIRASSRQPAGWLHLGPASPPDPGQQRHADAVDSPRICGHA